MCKYIKYDKFSLFIITLALGFLSFSLFSCSSGGNGGTEEPTNPPRLVDTADGLKNELKKCGVGCTVKLAGDVMLDAPWTPMGIKGDGFEGTLDGAGLSISGLDIVNDTSDNLGIFGYIDEEGIVKNLVIKNPRINGNGYIGSLAGWNGGTIEKVRVEGGEIIGKGDRVGGLVGENNGGKITHSSSSADVTGNSKVGGLVGYNKTEGETGAEVKVSYATGHVAGNDLIGGLVGDNDGKIINSYAVGEVSGVHKVGGLSGTNYVANGVIEKSYASGLVKKIYSSLTINPFIGGFVGDNSGKMFNSYYDEKRSSTKIFAGYGSHGTNIAGVSEEANIKRSDDDGKYYDGDIDQGKKIFINWDFTGTGDTPAAWKWLGNGKWPQLSWQ